MKKKMSALLAVMTVFMSAIMISALLANNTKSVDANEEQTVQYYNPTEVFISQIAESARQLGQENDLYASVMIAQAILESNSGRSGLASAPHYNLFGVKGHYGGQSATMLTWEDDGQGNAYNIDAEFRSYPSYYESLQDYVAILRQGYYANAWKSNTTSYQDATEALTGVYATDSSYNAKLNYIIEKYNLTQYDTPSYQQAYSGDLVYNIYRQQYTSQETLDEDVAWANR